jgi:hypothetical protein
MDAAKGHDDGATNGKDHRDPLGLIRRVTMGPDHVREPGELLSREWLVTNGLGGYAAGTLAGVITRRYHGLLIAALPAPLGRLVMMSQLGERLRLPGGAVHWLSGEERQGGALSLEGANRLRREPTARVPAGSRLARMDLRDRRCHARKAASASPLSKHRCHHLLASPRSRSGAFGAAAAFERATT